MNTLLIEYLRADGGPLRVADLGVDFMESSQVPLANAERPLRVEAAGKLSKAGNLYFAYEHRCLPLPDGLETVLRVAGTVVTMNTERVSPAGNPMRDGSVQIDIGGTAYEVSVILTKGKKPYWVKLHAMKASANPRPAAGGLIGGKIV